MLLDSKFMLDLLVRLYSYLGQACLGNPIFEISVIFLLLVVNGLFAMSEIAVVSARKARLQQWAEEGNPKALIALELANEPNHFLSTVQVGITLVGILAGAFGGATLAEKLALYFETIPALTAYSEVMAVIIVVISITYFSLIIGELVPKRLGLNNPERIAVAIAKPMVTLSRITSPIVRLLTLSTEVVIRLMGIKPSTEPVVTEEEIKVLIEQGTQVGVFEEAEQDMIEGVLRLGERRVGMLITPRTQIIWVDIEDSFEEIKRTIIAHHHSFFPIAKNNLDNLLGVVRAKDLLAQILKDEPFDLKTLSLPPLFVPERMLALRVLELFKQKGIRLAFVIDEYGSIQGMVTHDDILEDIVGNISLAGHPDELKAVQRSDGSWLVDGMLHIDELKEILDIDELPGEAEDYYQTVAGFVINQIGNIPVVGQSFTWGRYRFEVVDMDGRRVDRVLVEILPENQPVAEDQA
jgi:putative hemolysin